MQPSMLLGLLDDGGAYRSRRSHLHTHFLKARSITPHWLRYIVVHMTCASQSISIGTSSDTEKPLKHTNTGHLLAALILVYVVMATLAATKCLCIYCCRAAGQLGSLCQASNGTLTTFKPRCASSSRRRSVCPAHFKCARVK